MVVFVFDKLVDAVFWMVILVVSEDLRSTSSISGGDAIPGGYITNFQSLEVDVNDGVTDIGDL